MIRLRFAPRPRLPRMIATRAIALIAGVVVLSGSLVLVGGPARAADFVDAQGIGYEVDATGTGAIVVGFAGAASTVDIPAQVEIAGTAYPVTIIGERAFENNPNLQPGLHEVVIPDSVVAIENAAFMNNRLTEAVIPDSVTTIGDEVFYGNPLRTVTLGRSVTSIGETAFEHYDWDSGELLAMEVFFSGPPPATPPTTGWYGPFAEVDDVVVHYPAEFDASNHVDGYTSPFWRGYATRILGTVDFELNFAGASFSAQWVPVGSTFSAPTPPARPGWDFMGWFTDPGFQTPFDPTAPIVSDLTLYAGWQALSTVADVRRDGLTYRLDPADPGAGASVVDFDNSRSVLSLPSEIEHGSIVYQVTSIGDHALDGAWLTHVTIPNTVTSIGEYAFASYDASSGINTLTTVVIPDSVTSIGSYAFDGNSIESLSLGAGLTHIGEAAFFDNLLTEVSLPGSLIEIAENAFLGNALREVSIPDSVVSIGRYAFYMNAIEKVTLGASVGTIGEGAFAGARVTSIAIPDSVSEIGDYAFDGSPLGLVVLGSGVTSIGDYAFDHYDRGSHSLLPMDVYFTGPPPSTFQAAGANAGSFADPAGVLIRYPAAYGSTVLAGGYTAPRWHGYSTHAVVLVGFDLNGAAGSVAPVWLGLGDRITRPSDPARAGWVFTGWFTDSSLTTPFDFDAALSADTLMVAGWELPPTEPDDDLPTPGGPTEPDDQPSPPGRPADHHDGLPVAGAPNAAPLALGALSLTVVGLSLLGLERRRRSRRSLV